MDWQRIPTINAARVALRSITDNDLDSLYEIYSDPEVMRYWGSSPMKDRQEARDFLAEVHEDLRLRRCIQWGIAQRSDNRIIGTVAFFYLDFVAQKGEIGFALGCAHWGKGYMREALQAALGYAFNEMALRRIEADVDPRNLPSIRLLERLGFRQEGYLRERWLAADETQDSLFYGLLKKEWNSDDARYEVIAPPSLLVATNSLRARLVSSRLGRWAAVILHIGKIGSDTGLG
jgi:[ribosomal protein S5]-alanine N-acetyltransferase